MDSISPPAATYACNFNLDDSSCHPKTPVVNIVMGVILGLVGLFLCFLGQRFFHAGKSHLKFDPTS